MKLWHNSTKRVAKKIIGLNWYKLNQARNLKPGDLVSSCRGYNEIIAEIEPIYFRYKSKYLVDDFDLITDSGYSCSILNCCIFPLKTREQIIKSWLNWLLPHNKKLYAVLNFPNKIMLALKDGVDGKDIFNENGTLKEEYK